MFDIRITDVAEADIQRHYEWWRDNRSVEQAERWYDAIFPAIATLTSMPERCSFAREREQYDGELRQLHFGVGRHATHRILFAIEDHTVFILMVMHVSQGDIAAS